jgi:hypothetical protein
VLLYDVLLCRCVRRAECNGRVVSGGQHDVQQERMWVACGKRNVINNSGAYLVFVDASLLNAHAFKVTHGGEHVVGPLERGARDPGRAVLVRVGV